MGRKAIADETMHGRWHMLAHAKSLSYRPTGHTLLQFYYLTNIHSLPHEGGGGVGGGH
jgi:hypothetical protein